MGESVAVNVEHLNITFGTKKVVKDVSFQIHKGEINGFLGISGAGKTTIIRVLTCQIPKEHWTGTVLINNLSPERKEKSSKDIGNRRLCTSIRRIEYILRSYTI